MSEKKFTIKHNGLVGFYGTNDQNLERIKSYFPNIKIIARGNQIKVIGSDTEIQNFEKKLQQLIDFYTRFNKLSLSDIDDILSIEDSDFETLMYKDKEILVYGRDGKAIRAKTPNQKKMVEAFQKNDLIFAIGPAGTGKTYIAIALAINHLRKKAVQRIILSRPAVEAGEKLGFLPGDYKEKLDPYLQALYDALDDMIPAKKLHYLMEERVIQIAPLAYMRGRTLSNAVVILDEAQNTTVSQLKMFLTRMGQNSKFIITGDITQVDLPADRTSGLLHAYRKLVNIKGIAFIRFDKSDVVRHPLVKQIIAHYDDMEEDY